MRNAPIINAVPTTYRGVTFRSRTEARWAVYFDALDVPWHYEPEGYELDGGTRYLPDFWLPKEEWFIEVKPDWSEGSQKAEGLALLTRRPVFVTNGPPRLGEKMNWDDGHIPYWEVPRFRVCNPNQLDDVSAASIRTLRDTYEATYQALPHDEQMKLKDDLDAAAYGMVPLDVDPMGWEMARSVTEDGVYVHWWHEALWRRGKRHGGWWASAKDGWTWTIWDMASSWMAQEVLHTWGIEEQRRAVREAIGYRFWNPGGGQ